MSPICWELFSFISIPSSANLWLAFKQSLKHIGEDWHLRCYFLLPSSAYLGRGGGVLSFLKSIPVFFFYSFSYNGKETCNKREQASISCRPIDSPRLCVTLHVCVICSVLLMLSISGPNTCSYWHVLGLLVQLGVSAGGIFSIFSEMNYLPQLWLSDVSLLFFWSINFLQRLKAATSTATNYCYNTYATSHGDTDNFYIVFKQILNR